MSSTEEGRVFREVNWQDRREAGVGIYLYGDGDRV